MNLSVQMLVLMLARWAAAGNATAQVPRTDTTGTGLPDGRRVEFASRYSWNRDNVDNVHYNDKHSKE